MDNLKVSDNHLSILITEDVAPASVIEHQRRSIAQIMFEELNIDSITFMKKPMLSAFSVGSPTALILDSGHTQSRATVVQDGFCLDSEYVPYGGGTINSILKQKI